MPTALEVGLPGRPGNTFSGESGYPSIEQSPGLAAIAHRQ
jgi:hypothetical protein